MLEPSLIPSPEAIRKGARPHMPFVRSDGGRAAAGYKGNAGDCVTRSICIITGLPYQQVYDQLSHGQVTQRKTKRTRSRSAATGISTRRKWFDKYIEGLGFTWVPTMKVGQGCKVHLVVGELPMGKLLVNVSKHLTAVIDGVIYDTYDPQRRTFWYEGKDGKHGVATRISERCVYGYWIYNPKEIAEPRLQAQSTD